MFFLIIFIAVLFLLTAVFVLEIEKKKIGFCTVFWGIYSCFSIYWIKTFFMMQHG